VQAVEDSRRRIREDNGEAAKSEDDPQSDASSVGGNTDGAESENTAHLIQESIALIEQQRAELADEAALLRLLATLGTDDIRI